MTRTTTFCDRCGREIKYGKAQVTFTDSTTEDEEHIYDLCENCRDKFIDWMIIARGDLEKFRRVEEEK